jgi:tetratricopeptide (TPR) repeat protein
MIRCLQLIPFTWAELAIMDEIVLNRLVLDLAEQYEQNPEKFIEMLVGMVIEPNREKAYSLMNAANLLSNRHYYYLSLKAWEAALDYFGIVGNVSGADDKHSQSLCYLNLGNDFSRLERFEKAIECYEKAMSIALERGFKDVELNCHIYTGLTYFQSAKYKKAIESYEKAIDIGLETGNKDAESKGYYSIAACYTKLNNHQKAKEFRQKAENLI